METQVRYKVGNFVTYTATRAFSAVDRPDIGALRLEQGEEVQFDGYTLKYGDEEIKAPNLRSAVKANWLVPEGADLTETVAIAPRNTKVFAGGSVLDTDERIIFSQGDRTSGVRTHNHQQEVRRVGRHQVVMEGGDEGEVVSTGGFKIKAGSPRNTPPVDMSTSKGIQAIRETTNYQREGVVGVSQDEYLERMDPAAREEYLEKLESRRASILASANLPVPDKKKGKKSTQPAQPEASMERAETKIEKDGTLEARKVVAKSLCADFPDTYDFSQQWKKRLANIRFNFEERPDVIRAIFAAESDDFKKVLLSEFPEVFK